MLLETVLFFYFISLQEDVKGPLCFQGQTLCPPAFLQIAPVTQESALMIKMTESMMFSSFENGSWSTVIIRVACGWSTLDGLPSGDRKEWRDEGMKRERNGGRKEWRDKGTEGGGDSQTPSSAPEDREIMVRTKQTKERTAERVILSS